MESGRVLAPLTGPLGFARGRLSRRLSHTSGSRFGKFLQQNIY
jgi:hypothetical protein